MIIIGLHASFALGTHDPGVSLVINGEVKAIYEEERFNRIKLSRGHFPLYSLKALLKDFNLSMEQVSFIATTGATSPWLEEKVRSVLVRTFGCAPRIRKIHHQYAHMWCALLSGCPEETNFICVDAFGDGKSGIYGRRTTKGIESRFINKRESLGNFYAIGTSLLGFTAGEDEYKVMGLAAYGDNTKAMDEKKEYLFELFDSDKNFEHILSVRNNYESFHVDSLEKEAHNIYGDINKDFAARAELAYDIQRVFEAKLFSLVDQCAREYPTQTDSIALAGGCALNCQANLKLSELGYEVFVSPVSSDRGLALGSALALTNELGIKIKPLEGICYGQDILNENVNEELRNNGLEKRAVPFDAEIIAEKLVNGAIIGLCSGRSEAGARALGRRSIIADPSITGMKDKLNKKIKYREAFRPFAPAVLDEDGSRYFLNYKTSRFMTQNFRGSDQAIRDIPECIHSNGTARVQSVVKSDGKLYEILKQIKKIRGAGILINTSFNLKGQPIVQTERDALGTFHQCGIDELIIGDYVLSK